MHEDNRRPRDVLRRSAATSPRVTSPWPSRAARCLAVAQPSRALPRRGPAEPSRAGPRGPRLAASADAGSARARTL